MLSNICVLECEIREIRGSLSLSEPDDIAVSLRCSIPVFQDMQNS